MLLVIRPHLEDSAALLQGIVRYERAHQLWSVFHDDQGRTLEDPSWIQAGPWDGVISDQTSPRLIEACAAQAIPLVDLDDSPARAGVPKIRPDNHAVGRLAAEHFLERGYSRFAFAGFAGMSWSEERRDGFTTTLRARDHACQLHEAVVEPEATPCWDKHRIDGLRGWLRVLPQPCALMACNDHRALQVLAAAEAEHIAVPEAIAVLGCHNESVRCEMAKPELSSIALDAFQVGYRAAETLAGMIQGSIAPVPEHRVAPRAVITRRSTDTLAVDHPQVAVAIRAIREHACRAISVTDVARLSGVRRSLLERLFRRTFGRSPKAEIRRVQVDRARHLLATTDYPLKQIASLVGFEHMAYLCVVFKRLTGETPGAYRDRMHTRAGWPARSSGRGPTSAR